MLEKLDGVPARRIPVMAATKAQAMIFHRVPRYRPTGPALNVGTGGVDMPGWVNLDETKPGDLLARVPPFPFRDRSFDDVMLSHVLEHMHIDAGTEVLRETLRVLRPGGHLTLVVPDMKAVSAAYLLGMVPSRRLNDVFVYSYYQESHHRWCYDRRTLKRLLLDAGFAEVTAINRFTHPRLLHPAWFQAAFLASAPT